MKKNLYLIILLFLLACHQTSEKIETNLPYEGDLNNSVRLGNTDNLSFEEFAKQMESDNEAHLEAQNIIKKINSIADWRIKHQIAQAFLAKYQHIKTYGVLSQTISFNLLNNSLLNQNKTDKELQKAIGFYVEILFQNQSPEAGIILNALEKLKGHWEKNHIKEIAKNSLLVKEKSLEKSLKNENQLLEMKKSLQKSKEKPTKQEENILQSITKRNQNDKTQIENLKKFINQL